MALRWTHLDTGMTTQWSELVNLVATVDRTEEFYQPEDLAEELEESGFDREQDSVAVWDDDVLVASAQLNVSTALTAEGYARAFLGAAVRPDRRGQGIGATLMDRLESRALELARERHPGAPAQLRVSGGLPGDPVRALLEHRGYEAVRYFTDMARPLPGDPLGPTDPRVRPYRAELAEAVRLAHNDAFSTHWGSTPRSPEQWAETVTSRSFRPGTSTVLAGADGVVLAYVVTSQWVDRELYVGLVGTRRAARGQGLARACLVGAIAAAVASGAYDVVELNVDSENPSGAGGLYTSLGFHEVRTTATYAKVVIPAPTAPAPPPARRRR